ncbi:YciI family protein [Brevibacterium sp. CT2-23B]|uniref:YciI family protein n=1 Tax=Brevibacterium sp. CT2-23B TaxID=2729630 RepID=UPI0015559AA5|nr:YciI family protein [Brevibacterium sp. CT2-23B]
MRYSLIFHAPEPGADGPAPTEEDFQEMMRLMDDFGQALTSAGVVVAWEMLAPHSETKTVTRRTGEVVIEDGPFAAAKEALAGVVVIDVPDIEAALAWAEKFPGTSYGTIEVRPAATSFVDGAWTRPGDGPAGPGECPSRPDGSS